MEAASALLVNFLLGGCPRYVLLWKF
uniref:Uncharacterized protein n=1 Tax=Anguilla anguilla TaxID=7936 RepID=A0A0E9SWJ3_ANGAN